jgi:GAF domain-containing protein
VTVIVSDIATDPLWDDYRQYARPIGLAACWSTPIMSSKGKMLGSFAMYYREARISMNLSPGNLPKLFVCQFLRAGFFEFFPTMGFCTIASLKWSTTAVTQRAPDRH